MIVYSLVIAVAQLCQFQSDKLKDECQMHMSSCILMDKTPDPTDEVVFRCFTKWRTVSQQKGK